MQSKAATAETEMKGLVANQTIEAKGSLTKLEGIIDAIVPDIESKIRPKMNGALIDIAKLEQTEKVDQAAALGRLDTTLNKIKDIAKRYGNADQFQDVAVIVQTSKNDMDNLERDLATLELNRLNAKNDILREINTKVTKASNFVSEQLDSKQNEMAQRTSQEEKLFIEKITKLQTDSKQNEMAQRTS